MNGFINNAANIFEAAQNVMNTGEMPSDYTILLGVHGGMRLIADSDWPLDSLLREQGGGMAFRVKPTADKISVDGQDGQKTCHFESASPAQTARMILNSVPVSNTYVQLALAA